MMGADSEPTRREGSEMDICSAAHLSKLRVKKVSSAEKIPGGQGEDRGSPRTRSSAQSPWSGCRPRVSSERSRTGRLDHARLAEPAAARAAAGYLHCQPVMDSAVGHGGYGAGTGAASRSSTTAFSTVSYPAHQRA